MARITFVRTSYLYLLSLIGLILLLIGGSGFVSMALRTFVFTHADDQHLYREMPPKPYSLPQHVEGETRAVLRDSTKLRLWEEDYEAWRKRRDDIDPVLARRHREAANNLSFILVGLPVYLYHWRLIKRDRLEKNGASSPDDDA